MTINPYATTPSIPQAEDEQHILRSGQRLDSLSRITIGACLLWFAMMLVGRAFDENAPPLRSELGFYFVFGIAPGFGLYGALSTLRRRRYPMAVLGAACMSIPLLGPWCGLVFPVGIWTLVLLRRPAIRDSFTSSLDLQSDGQESADDLLAHAAQLDAAGEWDRAIGVYRDAAARWPEHATYVENCISAIASKKSAAS